MFADQLYLSQEVPSPPSSGEEVLPAVLNTIKPQIPVFIYLPLHEETLLYFITSNKLRKCLQFDYVHNLVHHLS
jgi:hypothetical protein